MRLTITAAVTGIALGLVTVLGACGKTKPVNAQDARETQARAKRQQAACVAPAGYDRIKAMLFNAAIDKNKVEQANLDTMADYSFARMEDPVVTGWDPALDITSCRGRFVLLLPPGAERGLNGQRQLFAEIAYTAQAAADHSGYVYHMRGGDPIIDRLAAFDARGVVVRPPAPGVDSAGPVADARSEPQSDPEPGEGRRAEPPSPSDSTIAQAPVLRPRPTPEPTARARKAPRQASSDQGGEATVRAFYAALRAADGQAASARVVPEKRDSSAYSPQAIARFYSRLPEPIQLTRIAVAGPATYRVSYRYSGGRTRCNGTAIVAVTSREGRTLIRSIRALSGC